MNNWGDICKHCKRKRESHLAKTHNCPIGRNHRVYGYTQFNVKQTFELGKKAKVLEQTFRL